MLSVTCEKCGRIITDPDEVFWLTITKHDLTEVLQVYKDNIECDKCHTEKEEKEKSEGKVQ